MFNIYLVIVYDLSRIIDSRKFKKKEKKYTIVSVKKVGYFIKLL